MRNMPISRYGVLTGLPVEGRLFQPPKRGLKPHYHIRVRGSDGRFYDVAVNILSFDGSEVLYHIASGFRPPNIAGLKALTKAMTILNSAPAGLSLDYLRTPGLITREQMILLPIEETTSTLHNEIDELVQRAVREQATVYAFGRPFRNNKKANPFWGFSPDQGIHDIHLNQLNPEGRFGAQNAPFQDGALFVEFPDGSWSAVFIAFQTQWGTDAPR
jgi:uncharacterized protein YukJ